MRELILTVVLTIVIHTVVKANSDDILYQNSAYTLYKDRIVEGDDKAYAKQRGPSLALYNSRGELVRPYLRGDYPQLETSSEMINMLYRIALNDLEVNIIDNKHFRVSHDFHYNMFFTRDIAFSSMLGANYAFANLIKSHLKECRQLRRSVGFKAARGHKIPIKAVEAIQKEEKLSSSEFFEKYSTHSYARRTDDVCWISGYWAAMQYEISKDELNWFVNEFEYFDKNFYDYFLDKTDGLYRGQAAFIDVGGSGYPDGFTIQQSVMIKALSTNCLYYNAFQIMAQAYKMLNNSAREKELSKRATDLKQSILKEFYHPDGYYAYFKHEDGSLEAKREQLGMSFLVLFNILPKNQWEIPLKGYPQNDFGNPLFWPFYPNEKIYHNNSIWPFANTFFNQAEFAVSPKEDVIMRTLGNLSRHALQGNFNEVYDYQTGGKKEIHARQYTWSAAAFLNVIYNMLIGIEVTDFKTISFKPNIPHAMGNETSLRNLKIHGSVVNLTIKGSGNKIGYILVNGQKQSNFPVELKDKKIEIEILMNNYQDVTK